MTTNITFGTMTRRRVGMLVLTFAIVLTAVSVSRAYDQITYEIQQRLIELGYDPGSPDGVAGRRTREAIEQFQADHGLPVIAEPKAVLEQLGPLEAEARQGQKDKGKNGSEHQQNEQPGMVLATTGPAARDPSALPVEIVPQLRSAVRSSALSPDAKLLAMGYEDGTARLWDIGTGRMLRTFVARDDNVHAVAFTADGKTLAVGTWGAVELWDVLSGELEGAIDVTGLNSGGLVFSNNGRLLLTTTWDAAQLWDAGSGRPLLAIDGPPDGLLAATLSADGTQVLTGGGDDIARLWDVRSGSLLRTFEGHSGDVTGVALSADGTHVLTGSEDGTAKLWDAASGELLQTLAQGDDKVTSVAFSPDGRQLLTGHVSSIARLWDATSGSLLHTYEGHHSFLLSVFFLPAGDEVLTVSDDDTARLWDVDGTPLRTVEGRSVEVWSAVFSADGRQILTASQDQTGRLWDLATGTLVRTFDEEFGWSGVLSSDGSRVLNASFYDRAMLRDAASGEVLREFATDGVSTVAFSPDGGRILTGGSSVAILWDAANGDMLHTFEDTTDVQDVAFSPNGRLIAVASTDGTKLWDAASGKLLRGFGDGAYSAVFSPDGTQVLTGSFGGAQLWDAAKGVLVRAFDGDDLAVAFSADGSRILTGSSNGTARMWDAESGRLLRTFKGHSDDLVDVKFSPDGKRVMTASEDTTVGIWDADTGSLLAKLIGLTDHQWVTITPEGFFDASPEGAEQLNIVRGLKAYSIDQAYNALYRPDLVAAKLAGDRDGLVAAAAAKLDLQAVIESGAAPHIVIASPAAGAAIAEDVVEVSADITDSGGGIGKIEWRVNGVTLGIDTRGFDRLAIDGQQAASAGTDIAAAPPVRVNQTLTLDPGDNLIEVVAYNEQGLLASEPARITVNWDGISVSTPPRLYVLSVGVNDYYDSRLALTYAAPDAQAIGAAFATAGRDLYENVEVTTVLDADVTATHLSEVFDNLGAKVRPRDVFVLFMAGHGKTQDGRYYFLPQDFRYTDESSVVSGGINQDQFQTWLARIPARKSVLLYDTCDSGALTNAATNRGLEEVAALARMTRAMGRTVLSASTDDAPALEGYNGHGVFTFALLQALGEGDANGDGTIEVTELAGAIDKAVPEISYAAFNLRQIPQMSIVGSDFPLTSKAMVLAAAAPASSDVPATIPSAPTHVVIQPTVVASEPGGAESGVTLTVGAGVRVLQADGDWSYIAREGQALGYVRNEALVAIQ
jgi:WD40 repeat protein